MRQIYPQVYVSRLASAPAGKVSTSAILNRYVPSQEVRVFGSRVHTSAKLYSDLDLVVMGSEPLGPVLTDLICAFSESDLPYKVDVLAWASASPHFQDIVTTQSVLLKDKVRAHSEENSA